MRLKMPVIIRSMMMRIDKLRKIQCNLILVKGQYNSSNGLKYMLSCTNTNDFYWGILINNK